MNHHPSKKFAIKLIEILEGQGFKSRLVGGCVRDELMGVTPKDYDVATQARPLLVCDIFRQKNIAVIKTGIEFGTVLAKHGFLGVEVTTLRKDISTNGRHPVVTFSDSFEEDSLRRDFTMNAMYMCKDGNVFDFHSGQEDLKNKIIRFVGVSQERVREDYLRILRMYRFWGRLGFTPEHVTRAACKELTSGLQQISGERIQAELSETLVSPHLHSVYEGMLDDGVYTVLFGSEFKGNHQFLQLQKEDHSSRLWLRRCASLLLHSGLSAKHEAIAARLRLSNGDKAVLETFTSFNQIWNLYDGIKVSSALSVIDHISKRLGDDMEVEILFEFIETQLICDKKDEQRFLGFKKQVHQYANRRKDFPLDGQILMSALGLKPSVLIGELLLDLRMSFYDGKWKLESQGIEYAKKLLKMKPPMLE